MNKVLETIRNTRAEAQNSNNRAIAKKVSVRLETALLNELDQDSKKNLFTELSEAKGSDNFLEQLITSLDRLVEGQDSMMQDAVDDLLDLFEEWMDENNVIESDIPRSPDAFKRDWVQYGEKNSDFDKSFLRSSFEELLRRV